MAKSIESLVSFSAGEWSPTLVGRVDQQKYRAACLQQRNMIALKTGPATRRPGTLKIAQVKDLGANYCARLEDYQFSTNTTFTLEWGHNYVRFYSNQAQVVLSTAPGWLTATNYLPGSFVEDPGDSNNIYYSAAGINGGTVQPHLDSANWVKQSIYEVPTPYSALVTGGDLTTAEVFQLKFAPINDVIYICHQSHPRAKLTRFGDTNWQYQPVVDLTPALLDQNLSNTYVTLDKATGSNVAMGFQAPAWVSGVAYAIGNSVKSGPWLYVCLEAHFSGTFATDLANGLWEIQTILQNGHVGSYWEIAYLRPSSYVEYDGVAATGFAAGQTSTITAFGAWEMHTYGVWSADIALQASTDNGLTWQTVRSVTGRGDRNVDIQGTAAVAQLFRIVVTNVAVPAVPGATNPRVVFECVDAFLFGIVQITSITGFYGAKCKVITPLPLYNAWVSLKPYVVNDTVSYLGSNYTCTSNVTSSTTPDIDTAHWLLGNAPTTYWSEGAWSDVRGYPAAITVFQQRVWCGFSAFQPQRIWGTQVNDIENWDLGDGTLATDGVAFDLDATGDGAILWLQAQDNLFVGLVESEWIVSAADQASALGPTNVAAHRQSRWGSNPTIGAIVVGDALVFAQRQAFSIRQMLYSVVTNKYMSQDLTALSDQILNGGAVQLAYQKQGNKNGFVWATTVNGELCGMTYELDQEIFGWHRHYTGLGTDAGFESVCCIRGKGRNDDEVWVVVNRTVGGQVKRFVELLNPVNWQTILSQPGQSPGYGADKNQAYYVDCGLSLSPPPNPPIITGLGHLEGRTVRASANGADLGTAVVSGGSADFTNSGYVPAPGDILQVGLGFKSTLQPMNLDVDVHTGVTQGIKKKVTGLYVNLLNTLACICTDGSFRVITYDGKFIVGQTYTIIYAGTTDFTTIGAANNNAGTTFVATGTGSGSGSGFAGSQPRQNEIDFRRASAPFDPVQLFTGTKTVKDFAGEYGLTVPVILYTDGPLPLTVLGVAVAYDLAGKP